MLCACTRPNPLFGDGADASGDGSGVGESGASSSNGAATSRGSSSDGTTGASGPPQTSTDDGGHATTTLGDVDAGLVCKLPEPLGLAIDVTVDGNELQDACELFTAQGVTTRETGGVSVTACAGCDLCVGSVTRVSITGVDLPELPACGTFSLWGAQVDGACEWHGLAVYDDGGLAPYYVLSLQQTPSAAAVGPFPVMASGLDACPSPDCSEASTLRLTFPGSGDTNIAADDAPKAMELAFVNMPMGAKWLVDNLESMIRDDCGRHIAWTATHL